MSNFRNVYFILFSLYWAQGLPVGFMTHALPVILRAQGVSLAHIGGFGLLMLPWSIKIFWAPLVDKFGHHRLGHYRSWIIPTQLLTIFVLIALSYIPIESLDQPSYLFAFFIVLLSMNLIGATQDVATDGLAVNVLKNEQQHWGNTFQVVGSRLGFIVGGGAILWVLDWLSWQMTFLSLATLVALNTLPILFAKEPSHPTKLNTAQSKHFKWQDVKVYLSYFTKTPLLFSWLIVLITFKIADGLSGPLLKPLMVDMGLSFSQIGVYVTILGACAALLGAGLAGLSLKFIRRTEAFIVFLILKVISLAAYAWLAVQHKAKMYISPWVIYVVNALEDMISSMLLVVMLTLVMQYSRKEFAGTDFTFQVAIMATVSGVLYSLSGIFGDLFGYSIYLCVICIIAILAIIPVVKWSKLEK